MNIYVKRRISCYFVSHHKKIPDRAQKLQGDDILCLCTVTRLVEQNVSRF